MKTAKTIIACSAALVVGGSLRAQSTFQNLNFESADLSNPSGIYNEVPISRALPGWNASIGGGPVTQVWANDYSAGAATIDVFGPAWDFVDPGVISGNYTVFLQTFFAGEGDVSLWQNGTVPVNSVSLQFKTWSFLPNSAFSVSFAGNSLSPVLLSSGQSLSGQTYDLYGVNIAPYAGQNGRLEFTASPGDFPEQIELDDIAFSPSAVPEPSTLALMVMAGLGFGAAHWRRRRS